ncbi:MAG: LPS export ABC transporter periplasmic protein LptC [Betaproteobacteria bacterium]|nr:LPS export ABC transporter periplasmic protein LptC [Betaproteobacteria bacterium]
MKLRTNNLLPLLIVLFLAGLTLWLRFAVEQTSPGARASSHEADAIVENLKIVQYGVSGTPAYTMSARRMVHYPDGESAELELPHFEKRGADGATMSVTARHARISQDAGDARFSGDVLLRREATADRPAMLARTEYLHVMAARDLLRTDRPVTITEGNTVFSGIGMELNRATRQFTLLSQVRGTYDAIKRK